MLRKVLFGLVVAVMLASTALGKPLTLNEIEESICRVTVREGSGQSRGTGTCVAEDQSNYYVLTNAHVVGSAQRGTVEFFKTGYKTQPIPVNVTWKSYQQNTDYDFAILSVSKEYFKQYPPRIIPLAPEGYKIKAGYYISAVGCPRGSWAQGWEGRIDVDQQSRVYFTPAPVGGQSGSGLIVLIQGADGEWHSRVGAILTWRIGGQGETESGATGGAIPVASLYNAMKGRTTSFTVSKKFREVSKTGYALGSDGNIYRVIKDSSGYDSVVFPPGVSGVKILDWNYNPNNAQCPGGACPNPAPYSGGSSPYSGGGGRGILPRPFGGGGNQNPQPIDPAPIGGNPYGNANPPSIGAPWPGTPNPGLPMPTPTPEKPNPGPNLDDILNGGGSGGAPTPIPTPIPDKPKPSFDDIKIPDGKKEEPVGIFGYFSNPGPFAQGLGAGLLIAALGWAWNKFLKKLIIKKVDSLEDYIQGKVTERWGPQYGKQSRDLMEGVEESILGFLDDLYEKQAAKNSLETAQAKTVMKERISNGTIRPRVTVGQVMEAVKQAAKEVGDDTVTTEVPKKVDELLAKLSAQSQTK